MNLLLRDTADGSLQRTWKRSITVFSIDEGPLNLTGVANTMTSEESNDSSIWVISSSWMHPPSPQASHPVQWRISMEYRSGMTHSHPSGSAEENDWH